METLRYELADDGIATLTFDELGSPVNTMKLQWQHDLAEATDCLVRDKEKVRGVLLESAKSTFFAGAELKGVLKLKAEDAAGGFAQIEALKRSFRRIETLGRPVVALLNGAALGGGWEVALVAHARFALDDRKIQFGMPEVSLGLIPGATGITKTVRLLGLQAANPLLLEGRLFGPREALEMGLVDGLGDSIESLRAQALAWIADHPDATQPWDRKDYKMPGGTPSNPKIAAGLVVAPAMLAQKTRGLYPAAQAILEAMVEGAMVDYDTATRIESRKLAKTMVTQTTKNMVTAFFFDMNAVRSGKSRPRDVPKWKPSKIGVLGAGMMGAGIAHAAASRGIACVLKDVDADKARAGYEAVRKVTAPAVAKGRMTEVQRAHLLNLITPTGDAADLAGCDLIIEAVFEQRALKAAVTREAEPMLAPDGVFASNTSTLPISGLATASARPDKFVGLHFFSPVHKMKLVEIIRGAQTDDETVARAFDVVTALGKLPIVVNDSRGFFTSRVFGTFVMEGATMLAEGVPAPLIEHAALAAGMPVGPLAVLDETSLALSVHVLEQTRADLAAEGKPYEAGAGELLVERMVKELKRPGRAGGGGFYDYPSGSAKRLWPELRALFERPQAVPPSIDQLRQRLLYRQSIETARCLVEGVLTSSFEANIGSIFGIGFPAWTGGAMQFIVSEGRETFIANAAALAAQHGARFALSPDVVERIRQLP
ncbi:3-hydroxyacyl-CoA dehydrogenase NAD-binding domain-containing protein [Rhizobacter sp. Root404]|uniref:3-hydroxyacyl-CoA dehydrogenase NAD-binding domain-containing protein n=1 Tax=Rhizobacter sp. Root404 TaxID=1736528 RepID=UPI0006F8725F|nr:3-hydroxyacyl-CoA dehydrogenase NAD-binding domain-containing protein [Rhizobacter sp. Root404]KQW37491.1 3-hydroxyacyl-CoA dehydrogenase [Rhizobacter sp. Root404]